MNILYPVVILAGGLATRLRPLTTHTPKSLITVQGEPFISHQLRLLKKQGASRVIMAVGYLGDMIASFVGDGTRYGLEVTYSYEGNHLLGTAGAIKKALPVIASPNFFVLYGDSYLVCHYQAVQQAFEKANKSALMTVLKNNNQWDKSNIEYQHQKIIHYDKLKPNERMQHIDYGLGIFQAKVFATLNEQTYDLATLYQTFLQQDDLAAYEVKERFYEIGSIAGIAELEYYLSTQEPA
jgi:N-acetyl-alpha-D-muramate 1-phosphate uridylyltransferase